MREVSASRFRSCRLAILVIVCVAALATVAAGQTRRYAAGGLVFDYPAGWSLRDGSEERAQQLILDPGGGESALVSILAFRGPLTPQRSEEIKNFVGPALIEELTRRFRVAGADVRRTAATAVIGGVRAMGVRLSTAFPDELGTAEIYWLTLGGRPVYVMFLGSDAARARAASGWALVRDSLRAERSPGPPRLTPQSLRGWS